MKSNLRDLRFICFSNISISCIFLLLPIFNIKSVFLDKAARFSFKSGCRSTNYAASCPLSPSYEAELCRSFNDGQTNLDLKPLPVSGHTQTIRPTCHHCSDYKPNESQLAPSTVASKVEVKEDLVKSEKKGSFITEEAVKSNLKNPPYIYLIKMVICCILLMAALIISIKSVSLDMAAKFLYRSHGHSFREGQTNSYPSPVSRDTQINRPTSPSVFTAFRSFLVPYPMRISVSPGKVHQVFLNFRGKQLRYNFVSHLSDAFHRHNIKFFIDKNEQRGKDMKDLFVRIEESDIALAIFSTRYPESSWCMDELVKMKKLADQGKLQVIPIFYKVKAEDVRKQKSDSEFGKNFWRLAKASKTTGEQIKEWKEALVSITDKMGLSLGKKSHESDFLEKIVEEVQKVIDSFRDDEN